MRFSPLFIQAVSDWQSGGAHMRATRGPILKKLAANLDGHFRTATLCCFRRIALDKKALTQLGVAGQIPDGIASWTFDFGVAAGIKDGVPPPGEQGVIFEQVPNATNVILNLATLYRDPEFRDACERLRREIIDHFAVSAPNGTPFTIFLLSASATDSCCTRRLRNGDCATSSREHGSPAGTLAAHDHAPKLASVAVTTSNSN